MVRFPGSAGWPAPCLVLRCGGYTLRPRAVRTRVHVSITLKTERDSTGHLLVASRGSGLRDDVFFLGTGGTLAGDALLNRPGVYDGSNYRLLPDTALRRLDDLWNADAVAVLSDAEFRFYYGLLRAIGRASRSGKGICLDYPGV